MLENVEHDIDIHRMSREDAVLYIIENYGEQIKRLIFTYVKNYATTDDIFQEFLIKVYQSLDLYSGKASLKTWLFRVAINKSKDYLRSPIHRFTVFQEWMAEKEAYKSIESEMLEKEKQQVIVQTILTLPVKYREIFVLRFYQEMSIKQISNVLGLSDSTVKMRIMRGKKKLREKLGGEYLEEYEID